MTKASIARQFRDKYGMEMPTLKLARIMYGKNKLLFSDLENARYTLRAIEGKCNSNVKVTHRIEARPYNPYKLPDSYQNERKPFTLPTHCNNILLISDLHIPYHDINAITIALDYGKKQKVNTIFINGDLIDNAQVSRFERDMSKRSVKQEFDATKQFLVSLRNNFPRAEIYWLKGNHCVRWEKFLSQKVSEIWDDPYFHLEERLRLNEERVKLLDDTVLVKAGKLSITHGHHIFKGVFAPVSPARGAFLRAKQNLIVGHLHRASQHVETTLDGDIITCYSMSCLCELRPNYSPLVSNSTHGFAHLTIEQGGSYHLRNYQIIDGKIY
jgi:predicted phosphodiesterase